MANCKCEVWLGPCTCEAGQKELAIERGEIAAPAKPSNWLRRSQIAHGKKVQLRREIEQEIKRRLIKGQITAYVDCWQATVRGPGKLHGPENLARADVTYNTAWDEVIDLLEAEHYEDESTFCSIKVSFASKTCWIPLGFLELLEDE